MNDKSEEKAAVGTVAAVIQSFYTDFVLRDLVGKVTPGAVVLLTVTVSLTSFSEILSVAASASLGVWMFIIGLAWLTGLSVQGLGEFLWIRYFPSTIDRDTWQKMDVDFSDAATPKNDKAFERFTVIVEACGNGSVALLLSAILGVIATCRDFFTAWLGAVLVTLVPVVFALVGLIKMHFENVKRRYWYMEKVIAKRKPGVEKATKGSRLAFCYFTW